MTHRKNGVNIYDLSIRLNCSRSLDYRSIMAGAFAGLPVLIGVGHGVFRFGRLQSR